MNPVPGAAVHPPGNPNLVGYVSTVLPYGLLTVISPAGYHFVRPDEVVVIGPHPEQWDAHERERALCRRPGEPTTP